MPVENKKTPDDPAQSERFKATARELGADESPEAFERTLKRIAPQKPNPETTKQPKP